MVSLTDIKVKVLLLYSTAQLNQMVSVALYNLTPDRGLTQPWYEPSPWGDQSRFINARLALVQTGITCIQVDIDQIYTYLDTLATHTMSPLLLGLLYVIWKDLLWSKAWNGKWAQIFRLTQVKLMIDPPIWNCQSTEWTLCCSMSPMRAHSKWSTNKKI